MNYLGEKNVLSIQRESRWAPDDLKKTKFSCLCPDSNPEFMAPSQVNYANPNAPKLLKI